MLRTPVPSVVVASSEIAFEVAAGQLKMSKRGSFHKKHADLFTRASNFTEEPGRFHTDSI
jgi:hypothetical protein